MPDLKLELEPSPRMAKLASFELELEYSSRPATQSVLVQYKVYLYSAECNGTV